jgi:hypothetical protein
MKADSEHLLVVLDGLAEENVHCNERAVNALREAIASRADSRTER